MVATQYEEYVRDPTRYRHNDDDEPRPSLRRRTARRLRRVADAVDPGDLRGRG
ncbi:MAG: hypothetical protein ACRDO7_02165 [Nocardioidaceae bacterium]